MPTTCKIYFENNPKKIFFSGQKLHVNVRLKLTEEVKVRSVYIHLRGVARARFAFDDEGKNANQWAYDVLNIRKYLLNGEGKLEILPVGTNDFSFACTLPANLPSSFYGEFGDIKYFANVILRIPFWPDKRFEEKFTVFKSVNLNDYPSLQTGVLQQRSKHKYRLWTLEDICISGCLTAGAYAWDQSFDLQVSIENKSTYAVYAVDRIVACLERRTTYLRGSQCRTKFSTIKQQTISSSKLCFIPKLKKKSNIKFKVPPLIPPTDRTSKIIQYRYLITIKVFLSDQVFVSVDLPITIGTIPFDASTSATVSRLRATTVLSAPPFDQPYDIWPYQSRLMGPSAPEFSNDDTVSIRTYTSTPPPFPDDDFDLPTYEEALLLDQEIDINLQSIEYSFAQLHVKSTTK